AAARGRPAWCGLAVAAGTALKLWPVLTLPLFWRFFPAAQRRALVIWAAGGLLLAFGPFSGWLGGLFAYHAQRPVQIESSYGGLVCVLHAVLGSTASVAISFGSANLAGGLADLLKPVSTVLTALGPGLVLWLYWRRADGSTESLNRALVGLVAVLLLFSRVFSPQYALWLLPLAFLIRETRIRWAALAVCALTHLIYPVYYPELVHLELRPGLLVLVRSVVLAFLLGWTVAPWLRRDPAPAKLAPAKLAPAADLQPVSVPPLRDSLRAAVAPFVTGRVILALLTAAGSQRAGPFGVPWLDGWIGTEALRGWDVAQSGNVHGCLPLYPAVSGLLSIPLQPVLTPEQAYFASGLALTSAAFFLALVGLHRLSTALSDQGAQRTVWLAALFPFAWTCGAPVPHALTLSLTVWSYCLALERRPWAACGLAAMAVLTSLQGLLLAALLVPTLRTGRRALFTVALAVAGLMLVDSREAGRPFGFLEHLGPARADHLVLGLVLFAALGLWVGARLRAPLGWYTAASLSLPWLVGGSQAATLFPVYLALASLPGFELVLAVSVPLLAYFSLLSAGGP
ncbi:MAG: hypothetical protein AB1758_12565, partial [Candidatus Eremiobacterota bacterium]